MCPDEQATTESAGLDIQANRAQAKYASGTMVKRVLWTAIGQPLFRFSIRTMFGWRRFLLRLFGARIGSSVNIYRTVDVTMPWNLEVGDWSAIGEHALIYNLGRVVLGAHVTVSQRAHLCAGTHDYKDPAMQLLREPITIHDQAWICADAFVGPGLTIGQGAVVGARSVVTKDVEEWSVVAGNPARFIKHRQLKSG